MKTDQNCNDAVLVVMDDFSTKSTIRIHTGNTDINVASISCYSRKYCSYAVIISVNCFAR